MTTLLSNITVRVKGVLICIEGDTG